MPARPTRQGALARILATLQARLDRMIPEDESVPLKRATLAGFEDQAEALARQLKDALWDGGWDQAISTLKMYAERLGAPQPCDGADHPRRVPAYNVGRFEAHHHHLDHPTDRRKGWPIGSGVTESTVKQSNQRVRCTEQFWIPPGDESTLSLRALWLSRNQRWERHWNTRQTYPKAAQTVGDPDVFSIAAFAMPATSVQLKRLSFR